MEFIKKNWKTILFYIILFAFLLEVTTVASNYDMDLWARLIAGKGFIQTGHVLKSDFLSYTPTNVWYDHEWGSGVIFYLVQHYFSVLGIFFLQVFLAFALFFTISRVINMRGVKTSTPFNFLFYFFTYHSINIVIDNPIRCQLFSFLLFSIFLYILELSRHGKNKPLILLPFLMILWNNLHGGCVSGIGLIAIYSLGEALNHKEFKKYLYVLFLSIAFLIINPWGLSYLKFLLFATTMPRPFVVEWRGLYATSGFINFKIFMYIMLLTEFCKVFGKFSYKNLDKTKFLALLMTFGLVLQHVKMLPFFSITSACFVYDDFYSLYNLSMGKLKKILHIPSEWFNESFSLKKTISIYIIVLVSVFGLFMTKGIKPLLSPSLYPLREIEFLRVNNLKGKLFVNFGYGSYASYKLYPNIKIFMDGRYEEVYPVKYVDIMKQFYIVQTKNPIVLNYFTPDYFIIEKVYPAYNFLKSEKEWKLVFDSSNFGLFIRKDKLKTHYIQPSNHIKYYREHAFDTNINFKKSS